MPFSLSVPTVRFYAVLAGFLLYGAFGSPTPDGIGAIEILVMVLLGAGVRIPVFSAENRIVRVGLLYGLTVPLLIGAASSNAVSDIARDSVPFLFLFLPFFYGGLCDDRKKAVSFIVVLCGVGVLFSLRTLFAYRDVLGSPTLWGQGPPADLLYLANSPEVLFSALCCIGYGIAGTIRGGRGSLQALFLLLLSAVPVTAMALMMQRAGLGAVVFFGLLWAAAALYRFPYRASVGLALAGGAVAIFFPVFAPVIETLREKTQLVGLNSRVEEWSAVFSVLHETPMTFLFGEGWGGRLENPAVGGLSVNYTHSLFSALLLKTGVVGTGTILAGSFYPVLSALRTFLRQSSRDFVLAGAVIAPFLISSCLYASYKSLGFGAILLVFFIFSVRKLEKNPGTVS